MKWSGGGEYRTSYKVGHAVGFLTDISVMDRKGEIRVNCNTKITMMGNKCKNRVAHVIIWSRVTGQKT